MDKTSLNEAGEQTFAWLQYAINMASKEYGDIPSLKDEFKHFNLLPETLDHLLSQHTDPESDPMGPHSTAMQLISEMAPGVAITARALTLRAILEAWWWSSQEDANIAPIVNMQITLFGKVNNIESLHDNEINRLIEWSKECLN